MAKTATQLKALLKERGLPAGDAAKSTLVDRFLKGKKKAPKSNAARMAGSRANRSEAKMEEDKVEDAERKSSSPPGWCSNLGLNSRSNPGLLWG